MRTRVSEKLKILRLEFGVMCCEYERLYAEFCSQRQVQSDAIVNDTCTIFRGIQHFHVKRPRSSRCVEFESDAFRVELRNDNDVDGASIVADADSGGGADDGVCACAADGSDLIEGCGPYICCNIFTGC